VLEQDPNHLQANYNLGVFYWRGRSDYQAAATQFRKVVDLTKDGDERAQAINSDAAAALQQVLTESEATTSPAPTEGTVQ